MGLSFKDFYEDKTVLITGHTGFKGAWLTLWLLQLGAKVIGYSLEPPTTPSLFNILDLDKRIKHIVGDIRDESKLKEIIEVNKPDIIFHLAAQAIVGYSYEEPKLTYETNIMGTINLFEAVKETNSVRVFINVTSDKCYDNKEISEGYKESDPMGGYDPYSSSKGCAELVTSAYRNSFFNPSDFEVHKVILASVRSGNVIGGGDWGDKRLIPDCMRALSKGELITIRSPEAIRPWQYVLESLSGYLLLGTLMWEGDPKYARGWNFGPEKKDTLKVLDVVKKATKVYGKGNYEISKDASFHEAKLLMLEINDAKSVLGWSPIYNVDKAIEETAKWYSAFYSGDKNMYDYSITQIKQYINAAKDKQVSWTE